MKNNFFIASKTKVISSEQQENTKNTKTTIYNDAIYYEISKNIRNYKKLSPNEIEYIKKLQKENLLEIIEIYDSCMENIYNILNNKL